MSISEKKTFKQKYLKNANNNASNANLKTLLTSNNKCKLPDNSLPGVYLTSCKCGKKYVGETSLKVSTRMEQHKKTIRDEKWDLTGISRDLYDRSKEALWKRTLINAHYLSEHH